MGMRYSSVIIDLFRVKSASRAATQAKNDDGGPRVSFSVSRIRFPRAPARENLPRHEPRIGHELKGPRAALSVGPLNRFSSSFERSYNMVFVECNCCFTS